MGRSLQKSTITVVGVGQIGGSLALALKEKKTVSRIIGVDKEEIVTDSRIHDIVDYTTSQLDWGVQEADFVFLSMPVQMILKFLPRICSNMKPEAVLLDSGSTKEEISLLMKKFPDKILVGGHPMAGTEKAGFEEASASLFKDKVFALNFPTDKSLDGKKRVLDVLETIEAIPLEIDAERHDCIVALTSHLPYILSLSLSLLARDFFRKDSLITRFIARGFLGSTRLSLTHEEMGSGILSTNTSQIINMMNEFQERLQRLKSFINKESDGKLEDFLSEIRNFQSKLEKTIESSG